ncbi:MAG: polyprenyl synthetase family protein [Myxococcaceae bacterium]
MTSRIEAALAAATRSALDGAPPKFANALHYAVFPGGARVRPRLCLAVAGACGDDAPEISDAMGASIELLHCASLVHDDLPCFDDAPLRRGKPTVHRVFGEPVAVLVGDALIVLAFESVARAAAAVPSRMAPLVALLGRAAGAPHGLCAGQAWESESAAPLREYHLAKTGSLFTAATMGGALAAGADPAPWSVVGERLGEAYQVADDLLDALSEPQEVGKPTLRDAALARISAVSLLGVDGSVALLRQRVAEAVESIPACPGAGPLRALVMQTADRLVPKGLKQSAA